MSAVLEQGSVRTAAAHVIDRAVPADPVFARAVLAGLAQPHKRIAGGWRLDARGLALAAQIAALPSWYCARSETWLLQRCAAQIAAAAGPAATLIELARAPGAHARLLHGALADAGGPIDLDPATPHLAEAMLRALTRGKPGGTPLVYLSGALPGGGIGALDSAAAVTLLERIGCAVGLGALLVVAADATLDPATVLAAHDDAQGLNAALNKNLLLRINRELDGSFAPSAFRHEVRWNAMQQRAETHLVSEFSQRVRVLGRSVRFGAGETIHTASAHSHTLMRLRASALRANWAHRQLWMDGQSRIALHVMERVAPL
jgi:L-histidine Nalpha-methyltransferase